MKLSNLLIPILLACMAPSQASDFDCVQPNLPERSTSNEGVRRVQKQVRAWRSCYAERVAAGHGTPDAEKLDTEVNTGIEKWIENTLAYSHRSAESQAILARMSRERIYHIRPPERHHPVPRG